MYLIFLLIAIFWEVEKNFYLFLMLNIAPYFTFGIHLINIYWINEKKFYAPIIFIFQSI